MTTPATVTREHRAEALELRGNPFSYDVAVVAVLTDWLESGTWIRMMHGSGFISVQRELTRIAQALADRDVRIGWIRAEGERLLMLIQRTAATLETVGAVGHADWLRKAAGLSRPASVCIVPDDPEVTELTDAKAQLARVVGALNELQNPRPLDEYHDDYGSVLWWKLPVDEPPYVGAPGDSDWPGYHTHWTKCPQLNETEDHA